tara:strand:- start:87 stop:485 length:399 start_codon:yes stop_codon:yes gene_type:complete
MLEDSCNSDNLYHDNCPAKMSDGRFASIYLNDYVFNETIKKENGLMGNNEFRKYLQDNAVDLMNHDFKKVISCSCSAHKCVHNHSRVRVKSESFGEEMVRYNSNIKDKMVSYEMDKVKNNCGSYKHYRLDLQ